MPAPQEVEALKLAPGVPVVRSFRTSGCLFLPPRLGLGGGFEGERLKL